MTDTNKEKIELAISKLRYTMEIQEQKHPTGDPEIKAVVYSVISLLEGIALELVEIRRLLANADRAGD